MAFVKRKLQIVLLLFHNLRACTFNAFNTQKLFTLATVKSTEYINTQCALLFKDLGSWRKGQWVDTSVNRRSRSA